jgi:hypothetical protein
MNIPWSFIISIFGAIITTASLVYAIKTNREKTKFENLVRDKLAGIAGNVWKAKQSSEWSDKNFTRARDEVQKLPESMEKMKILEHIHNGARDSVASARMLSNLLGEVVSMQKGMFGTETIAHPDMAGKSIQSNDKTKDS